MIATREQVYEALYRFWSNTDLFVTTSRKFRLWTEVPTNEQPAAFQTQGSETPNVGATIIGLQRAWIYRAEIAVYTNTAGDPSLSPSVQMNELIDYFEKLFPIYNGPETLGGLVKEVRIAPDGIKTDEGALGSQAVALVPLQILTL